MSETLPAIRRIVTGDDAQGRSSVVEDAPAKAIRTVEGRPGYRSVNVWRTEAAPAPVNAPDSIAAHKGILPPKNGGSILRIIDFPPESPDPAERRRQIQATFTGTTSAKARIPASTAPTPWTTQSCWRGKSGR